MDPEKRRELALLHVLTEAEGLASRGLMRVSGSIAPEGAAMLTEAIAAGWSPTSEERAHATTALKEAGYIELTASGHRLAEHIHDNPRE